MESLPQDSLTTSHELGEGKRSAHVGWLRLRLKDSYDLAWNPLTSSLRAPLTSSFPPLVNPTPQPPHGINQELESRGWKRGAGAQEDSTCKDVGTVGTYGWPNAHFKRFLGNISAFGILGSGSWGTGSAA